MDQKLSVHFFPRIAQDRYWWHKEICLYAIVVWFPIRTLKWFLEHLASHRIFLNLKTVWIVRSTLTIFSDSPRHLLTTVPQVILKKVHWLWSATARANWVFPVPGGPCNSTPRQGSSKPVNISGYLKFYTLLTAVLRWGIETTTWQTSLASSIFIKLIIYAHGIQIQNYFTHWNHEDSFESSYELKESG